MCHSLKFDAVIIAPSMFNLNESLHTFYEASLSLDDNFKATLKIPLTIVPSQAQPVNDIQLQDLTNKPVLMPDIFNEFRFAAKIFHKGTYRVRLNCQINESELHHNYTISKGILHHNNV